MPTECNPELFDFGRVDGRRVVAAFDGGRVTSDAGVLLLGAADGLIERLAGCFRDDRRADLVEHRLPALIGQRVFAIALGYEDLIEIGHDGQAIERLFVDLFLEAHAAPPREIVLDLDATDDPLHGHQEGRFFHTATTTVTATCRCTSSVAGICSPPSCGDRISMLRPAASRKSSGSLVTFGRRGRGCGLCCVPIPASRGNG